MEIRKTIVLPNALLFFLSRRAFEIPKIKEVKSI